MGMRPVDSGGDTGGLYGSRTRDHILDREVLYQLS